MKNLHKICEMRDLVEGRGHGFIVNGRPIAFFLFEGRVYALEDRCCHREGQLSDGRVRRGQAICPLHGWNFDLKTGISPYNPNDAVPVYPVTVENGAVYVDPEAVPPLPEGTYSGYQGRWKRWNQDARGHHEIRNLAQGMKPPVEAMGSTAFELRAFPGFDHFHLKAAQLARLPLLEHEPVSTETLIGRGAGKPLRISLPAYVSHMSFGALSREAKIALARGSRLAGTLICSGEGGMLPQEREEAALYILEMASGYFGFRDENIAKADAVEIKIGQSAKPGLGGELPAAKVTVEIAEVRGLEPGQAAVSPSRFPDMQSLAQLAGRVRSLRERFPGKPIGVKIAANDIRKDVEAALSLEPDFITVDGFGGGTGAAPLHVRDHFGASLVMALPAARWLVDRRNDARPSRPVSLIAAGGIRTPSDVMKAIALGADACALATASLIALGCEYYRACETGNCPVGITTHTPRLRERLDVEKGATRVARFFTGMKGILEDYLRAMGRSSPGEVDAEDLVPLTRDAEAILHPDPFP